MTIKTKYTENFEQFWKAYPRKTAKLPAFKAWQKMGIDEDAFLPAQIIQDIEKRTRFKFWPEDKTKIPHAATFINQARHEDDWMDDIPKGGQSKVSNRVQPVDEYPPADLTIWQAAMNRMMLRYVRTAQGVEDIDGCVRIKNEVLNETTAAMDEEIQNIKDKRAKSKKAGECATIMADMMLARLDKFTGLSLRYVVMTGERPQ